MKKYYSNLTTIGWREWISFPEWGINNIKVKVDTGAKTSSIHAIELEYFMQDSKQWVRFSINPWQMTSADKIQISAPVNSFKEVKSSSGCIEKRPVVKTAISVSGIRIHVDLTLTNRSDMGFRMLLGRDAMKKHFLIIPGKSYLGGKPSSLIRLKNKGLIDEEV